MKKEKLELRKTIVKLYNKGKKQEEIAFLLETSQSTVSYWIIRHRETGLLEDKPRSGKPRMLTEKQLKGFKEALLDIPPPRFGGESFGWTTKMAIQYAKDRFNIIYSMRRMQELFHEFGLSLITPRQEHRKSSHAARAVYKMDFKKNLNKNIWAAPSLTSMR